MKRILFLLLLSLTFTPCIKSQVYRDTDRRWVLEGVLHEKGKYDPVSWAKIAVKGTNVEVYADAQGTFVIPDLGKGGNTWLQISHEDYEMLEIPVTVGGIRELGIIYMEPKQRDIHPITVNDLRVAGSDVRTQTFSEPGTAAILFGSNDALVQAANYQLGSFGLRLRGYEWRNTDVYFNGTPINEIETGYANPMLWNGLNDAMAKTEGSYGLNSSLLYYGNIGGVSNLRIRPSEYRQRFKASYSFSNSLYNHRLMLTYTSGQLDNGLSFLISASGKLGNGFIDGMKYEGLSYLFVVEKELADDQSLMLTVVGAPTKRGMQNYSTQEAYDIADDNFYNSAWGNDDGKRNSRVNQFHQPIISLTYNWDITDWTLWRTTAGFSFGKNSETALNWTSLSADPRPDTYDKLQTTFTDPDKQQINWQDIFESNKNNPASTSNYILGAQHSDRWTASLNSIYDDEITDNLMTTLGIQGRYYQGSFYNRVDDLLGGNYWLDVDKFAAGVTPPVNFEQNDMNHLNREVKTDDHFGYDYNISQANAELWNRWTLAWRKWDFMASVSGSYTSYWREGNMMNGKFPENSEGKSSNHSFFNYAAKAGASYPLFNGRIEGSGTYLTRAPQFRDAFILPQVSDAVANDLKSETVWGGELNYIMSGSFFSLRASGFYTQFSNQTRTRFYYDGDYQSLFSMLLTGLNQRHFGGELSVDFKLMPELTLTAAATYGIYKYTSNPNVTLIQQNINERVADNVATDMKDLYVAGTPQMAATVGLLYDSPKKWWIGANVNYMGNNYAEVNPMRFTQQAKADIGSATGYSSFLEQEKLPTAFTFDLYGGYTFSLGEKYYLGINLNAHNLFGSKKAQIGAYDPLTVFDVTKPANKYAANYVYAYGRTVFLIVSFRF